MKARLLIGAVLAGLFMITFIACAPKTSPAPSPAPPQTSTPAPAPVTTPTTVPTPASTPATAAAGLTLTISEPADETVVNQDTILVAGRTEPDAVVSVNGNIVTGIDEDGNFATAVSLLDGPNLIEVIASDYAGNQSTQTLTVIYTP
jgi:hypothetical protein